MIWSRLKNMKCPECNNPLEKNTKGKVLISMDYRCVKCPFYISSERFDEMIESLYRPSRNRVPGTEENLSALNNLGLEEEPEGFDNDEEVYI